MSVIELDKIGIVGGGINSALFCLEAKKKGIKTAILDPDMYCLAANIADEHLVAPFNESALLKLIHRVDAVLFTHKLDTQKDYKALLKESIPVYPEFETLETLFTRERFLWKMEQHDIPIMPYKILNDEIDVLEAIKNIDFPISVTQYYKGTIDSKDCNEIILKSEEDIIDLFVEQQEKIDYWIVQENPEKNMELSVGVTRDSKSKLYVYSVAEDIYEKEELIKSYVPARTTKTLQNKAISISKRAVKALDGIGTFTVKLGVTKDKEIYVKNIVPYSIENSVYTNESCSISQNDHLLRVMLGLTIFPATFDGVTLVRLEKESPLNNSNHMGEILSKESTNAYFFRGKTVGQNKLLYTFRNQTWEELRKNKDYI